MQHYPNVEVEDGIKSHLELPGNQFGSSSVRVWNTNERGYKLLKLILNTENWFSTFGLKNTSYLIGVVRSLCVLDPGQGVWRKHQGHKAKSLSGAKKF